MIRKLLFCASLTLLFSVVSAKAQPQSQQSPSGQQAEQPKSVTGTLTTVEPGGKAFTLEVDAGGNKQPMRFVLDNTTQVQGRVGPGTTATVEYVSQGDQRVAKVITPQGSQQQP